MTINLKPCQIDAEGKGSIAEKAFSEKGNEKKLFRLLEKVNAQEEISGDMRLCMPIIPKKLKPIVSAASSFAWQGTGIYHEHFYNC